MPTVPQGRYQCLAVRCTSLQPPAATGAFPRRIGTSCHDHVYARMTFTLPIDVFSARSIMRESSHFSHTTRAGRLFEHQHLRESLTSAPLAWSCIRLARALWPMPAGLGLTYIYDVRFGFFLFSSTSNSGKSTQKF